MNEESLIELIDRSIESGVAALPVFPRAVADLRNALKDENKSMDAIAKQISLDASVASQILRVANSPFYSGLSKINTVKEAIMRLGLATVVQIATLVMQKGLFASKNPASAEFMGRLWQHSVAVALGSEWLAKRLGFKALAEEAFMAGLFHDIGELLLFRCIEDIAAKNPARILPENLIDEVIVSRHQARGAKLLQLWNLPETYSGIAGSHHEPLTEDTSTVALMVRIADQVSYKMGIAQRTETAVFVSGSEEASRLGLSDVALAEMEIALEDTLALSG